MAVTMTSEAYGKLPGEVYTGSADEEAWLLAQGYAKQAAYTGPGVANSGASDVTPEKDPRLAENREEPGHGQYVFGSGNELAPADLEVRDFVGHVEPAVGPAAGGTKVEITGDNLVDVTGVTFGGVAGTALTVVDDKRLEVTAPAHAAGAVDVVVTDPNGSTTVTGGYTYE